jgi:hypothetical protein
MYTDCPTDCHTVRKKQNITSGGHFEILPVAIYLEILGEVYAVALKSYMGVLGLDVEIISSQQFTTPRNSPA